MSKCGLHKIVPVHLCWKPGIAKTCLEDVVQRAPVSAEPGHGVRPRDRLLRHEALLYPACLGDLGMQPSMVSEILGWKLA